MLAAHGSIHRQTAMRLAGGFAVWREVCFDSLPPVMRKLMHVRRRVEASEALDKAHRDAAAVLQVAP